MLIIQRQSTLMFSHFARDVVEEKKLLVVKVDTLKNVADALTKSMSTKNFSWCTEIMDVASLDQ